MFSKVTVSSMAYCSMVNTQGGNMAVYCPVHDYICNISMRIVDLFPPAQTTTKPGDRKFQLYYSPNKIISRGLTLADTLTRGTCLYLNTFFIENIQNVTLFFHTSLVPRPTVDSHFSWPWILPAFVFASGHWYPE